MFIQEADLFQGLSQEFMTDVSKIMEEKSEEKGTVLFDENDPADYFYVLMEGRVRLIVGRQAEIDYMVTNSGEAFGWSSLVDRDTYTARAECVAPSRIIKIEKNRFNKVLEKHPDSGMQVYKRLAAAVGQRLTYMYNAFLADQASDRPASFGSGQITGTAED